MFKQHLIIFIHYKSGIAAATRLVVDGDDNGKFRDERVKTTIVGLGGERVNVLSG